MRTIAFETSQILAEETVFNTITEWTKNDFPAGGVRGRRTDRVGVWALNTGGGDARDTHAKCWGSLQLTASIEVLFLERDRALLFSGWIQRIMAETDNFHHTENVQWFRVMQFPNPTPTEVEFPNNRKAGLQAAWLLTIPCEMVYNTTQAYEEGE
jgi:hypothetical protein